MDVRLSEEQLLLRDGVREFLTRECPVAQVRTWTEAGQGPPDAFWKQLAELGWLALPFPEAHGGAGLGPLDLAVVLEEMGRVLLPAAYLSSVILAGGAVLRAGDEAQRARLLPALAEGRLRATLALYELGGDWSPAGVALEARAADGGYRLRGAKHFVPDADRADRLAVVGRSGAGVGLFWVDRHAPGVGVRRIATADRTRPVHAVELDDVSVSRDDVLGEPGAVDAALDDLLDHARVALAAEMTGGAAAALDLAVAFARAREQFGQPIGSFQAIQHKCADMLLQVEGARSATYYAAWCLAEDPPAAHAAACMAKAWCSDAYRRVSGECIQIHGGLGFTWEQDPHVYFKRAKASEAAFGDATWHRERLARALFDRRKTPDRRSTAPRADPR